MERTPSGKSSLVRADSFPILHSDEAHWFVRDPLCPENNSVGKLARYPESAHEPCGVTVGHVDDVRGWLCRREGAAELVQVTGDMRRAANHDDASVVLVIDEFEALSGHWGDSVQERFRALVHSMLHHDCCRPHRLGHDAI